MQLPYHNNLLIEPFIYLLYYWFWQFKSSIHKSKQPDFTAVHYSIINAMKIDKDNQSSVINLKELM